MRWVLPRPTPPYIKRGLYAPPGFSATCIAAALASWFDFPSMKLSNVFSGFRLPLCRSFPSMITSMFREERLISPDDLDDGCSIRGVEAVVRDFSGVDSLRK